MLWKRSSQGQYLINSSCALELELITVIVMIMRSKKTLPVEERLLFVHLETVTAVVAFNKSCRGAAQRG